VAVSNLGLAKTLICCVNEGKLYEAIHIFSDVDWESEDSKNYHVKITWSGDNQRTFKLNAHIVDRVI
jgi:hypothetical protein